MKTYRILLMGLLVAQVMQAETNTLVKAWSDKTAYLLTKGTWETGLIQPLRYSMSDKVEWHTNALLLPILPNLALKYNLGERHGWQFATDHTISYPTLFLNTLSMKGIGGFISPEFTFKPMVSIGNSLIGSRMQGSNALLSVDFSVYVALREKKPAYQSTIDLPLLYPRMAHWYEGVSLRAGGLYRMGISNRLFLETFIRGCYLTRSADNLFFEQGSGCCWALGRSLRLKAGYILTYGTYPFGNQWQLAPTIDLVFGSPVF